MTPGPEAEARRETRIERGELEFLEEQHHERDVDGEHRGHHPHRLNRDSERPPPRQVGVLGLAHEHGIDVDVHVRDVQRNEQHADGEERGEDQADRGVRLHQLRVLQRFHERHREKPRQCGADEQPRRLDVARDEIRQHDAEDEHVPDGVGDERGPPQHEEHPRHGTGHGDKDEDGHRGGEIHHGLPRRAGRNSAFHTRPRAVPKKSDITTSSGRDQHDRRPRRHRPPRAQVMCEHRPPAPASAPNAPASTTITPSRLVHCRAAAPGATEQRGHEHNAHRLESDHHRDDRQRREQQIEPAHRKPDARRVIGIECQQLQLLPRQGQDRQRPHAERADDPQVLLAQVRGLAEEVPVERMLRRIRHVLLDGVQKRESQAEEDRERPAERRIGGNARPPIDDPDEHERHPPRHRAAHDEQHRRPPAKQERDGHSRQCRVRDDIPLQALPPEHGKAPHRPGCQPQERRPRRYGAERWRLEQ